ncbi:MAG: hypothetical protein LR017_04250 [Candidatus Pacebacteria bacterium]|nr:hypothetical protein [Candidatus Paceibacterota bacterium]
MALPANKTSNVRVHGAQGNQNQDRNITRGIGNVTATPHSNKLRRETVGERHLRQGAEKQHKAANNPYITNVHNSTDVQRQETQQQTQSGYSGTSRRRITQATPPGRMRVPRHLQHTRAANDARFHTKKSSSKTAVFIKKIKQWFAGTVAGIVYGIQLDFGILSAAGISVAAYLSGSETNSSITALGKGVLDFFGATEVIIEHLQTATSLSLTFAAAAVTLGFIIVALLYYREIQSTIPGILMAIVAYSASMMPFANLFPWIPAWVGFLIWKSQISTLTGKK